MRIYELLGLLSDLPINRLHDKVVIEDIGRGFKHIELVQTDRKDEITLCLVNEGEGSKKRGL